MDFIIQVSVFILLTTFVAVLTWFICRRSAKRSDSNSAREYFLASGGLSWVFVAGSITLTNLSTDQLVGMNGSQMALVALWELSAVVGLFILAKIFVPIYYHYQCTTTTELLEHRYNNASIRTVISMMFLGINLFIYMPVVLYTGSLFMQSMFGLDIPIVIIALGVAGIGGAYSIFGGLRAVAVSDTISGVGLLALSLVVVYLALQAIDFDFSGIPAERLTLIGSNDSAIPWHTLLTGMLFIQIFYWSTNQYITQRAMASKSVKEAQKGVFVAALIRLVIVPTIVVIPGICAFKLYGDIGDATYGRLVSDLLPAWTSGMMAAVMMAAVLSTFNSVLNSTSALYICDIHQKYFNKTPKISRLNLYVSLFFIILALCLVPVYARSNSILAIVQQINGLFSMPILAVFIVGICFQNVNAKAVIASVIFGISLYAIFTFVWTPFHYIHLMFITLVACIAFALFVNRIIFGEVARISLCDTSKVMHKKSDECYD